MYCLGDLGAVMSVFTHGLSANGLSLVCLSLQASEQRGGRAAETEKASRDCVDLR